ncbi:hypothetical protein L596_022581 [Steinernema carpocapsae]|uniref:Uncharacterized protein n=1 Tax=Steinernema carpocapsae TaxID=34508 RepID=A0A4U5MM79_STECR|nr:hypothetical protein L596_022581 [Steinernema carpocapsae]
MQMTGVGAAAAAASSTMGSLAVGSSMGQFLTPTSLAEDDLSVRLVLFGVRRRGTNGAPHNEMREQCVF